MQVTKQAANQLIKSMKNEGLNTTNTFVRMGVKGGGCSGFTYTLDFDNKVTKFDRVFTVAEGLTIVVDKKSHLYIHDTHIDWSNKLNDRGLKFNNPSAKGQCGCRTSFMIDMTTAREDTNRAPTWM